MTEWDHLPIRFKAIVTNYFLQLLGPPVLRGADNEPLPFRTRKQLGVLLYLVLEAQDRGIPRERLVELLWPDVPYEKGRHSLSQALTAIRHVLGKDAVEMGQATLKLVVRVRSDLDRPNEVRLNGLERPRPIDGMEGIGGVDFQHWLDGLRQHLLRTVRRALSSEVQDLRRSGDSAAVRERAEQLYRLDPRNETAVQTLAEQGLVDGDIDSAVALLEEYLAATPSVGECAYPDLERMLSRARAGVHVLDAREYAEVQSGKPFVGRAADLEALRAAWEGCQQGVLKTAAIVGPPGIGKSTLAKRFVGETSARGHVVITAACQHVARDIPFAALSDLMGALSRDPELSGTDPHWLAEASRVAPILRTRYPGIPTPQPLPADTVRFSIAEAFARMIETVAERSAVLIMIDDVHNLDPASRDALHVLARRLHDFPALILGVVRSAHLDVRGGKNGRSVDVFEWDHVVRVHPLSRSDAASMTADLLESNPDRSSDEQLVTSIAVLAGGHPYFIELLAADWIANGPQSLAALTASGGESYSWKPTQSLRTAFARHYSDLTDDARTTLEIVAIAGRSTTADEIAELGGLPLAAIHRAILDAISIGILGADGDAVHFNNEAHRAFVYHTTPDDTKRYHHARLGRSLQAAMSGDKTAQLEAAYHFLRADMPKEALETAEAGAMLAILHGAPQEAEKVLRAVISAWKPQTTDIYLLLAESLNLQGSFSESCEWLSRVHEKSGSPAKKATRSRLYAQALVRGRLADQLQSKAAVRECLRDAELAQRGATLSDALLIAGEFAGASHDIKTLESVRNSAIRISQATEDAASLAASNLTAGFCLLGQGTYAEAYEAFARSARAGEEASKFGGLVRTWNGLGICAYSMGEAARAHSAYRQAARLSDQLGDYRLKSNILANHGVSLFDLGEYNEAEKMFSRALAADKLVPDNPYRTFVLCNVAEFYMTLDDMDRAVELITEAETSAGSSSPIQRAQVAITRADLFLADGSPQQAREMVALAERVTGQDNLSGIPLTVHGFDRPAWIRLSYFRRWQEARNPPIAFNPMAISTGPLPLALLVELLIFQEWLGEQCGAIWSTPMTALQTVRASGLAGVVEKMRRVRMLPVALTEPLVATNQARASVAGGVLGGSC